MSERPLIAIPAAFERAKYGVWDSQVALLPMSYIEAVQRAGASVLLIPPDAELVADPDRILDLVDGLVLAGGSDVDPATYGQSPHPETKGFSEQRDSLELALIRRAIERDMPVLGICRGCQVLNIAQGGTLIQHVPRARAHGSRAPAAPRSRGRGGRPLADVLDVEQVRAQRPISISSSGERAPGRSGIRASSTNRLPAWSRDGGRPARAARHRRCRPRGSIAVVPCSRPATRQQRRDADRARALDDQLGPLEQEHHRLGHLVLRDDDHLVDPAADQRQRQLARALDGDAVGDRQRGLRPRAAPAAATREPARRPRPGRRSPDLRTLGLERDRHPADQPPPPTGTTITRQVVDLGEQLEAEPTLAGDHVGSSNGWTKASPLVRRRARAPPTGTRRRSRREAHRAPSASTASTLAIGAISGMNTSHGTPRARAA
jgi:hypothetical protein